MTIVQTLARQRTIHASNLHRTGRACAHDGLTLSRGVLLLTVVVVPDAAEHVLVAVVPLEEAGFAHSPLGEGNGYFVPKVDSVGLQRGRDST